MGQASDILQMLRIPMFTLYSSLPTPATFPNFESHLIKSPLNPLAVEFFNGQTMENIVICRHVLHGQLAIS